ALYVGISSYSADETRRAAAILRELGTPCLIHQPKYSLLDRWVENGLLDAVEETGMGCISFSSLAQGLLTDKYLNGIPAGSRASRPLGNGALEPDQITPENIEKVRKLNLLAQERQQSLAQMALAWVLKDPRMTSVIIGASKPEQVQDAVGCLQNMHFSTDELNRIETILAGQ
ncbi:MAG TPA: aldo/keto reductase, partial [Flavihumibacter sp.]